MLDKLFSIIKKNESKKNEDNKDIDNKIIKIFKKGNEKVADKEKIELLKSSILTHLKNKNYEKVVEICSENLDILDSEDYANYAYSLYMIGDYIEALNAINQALKDNQDNPKYLYYKGLILYKLNKKSEAYYYLIKIADIIKKSDIYRILGEISLENGKYEEALNYFKKAYLLNKKKNVDCYFEVGKIYLLFGDIENAYNVFKEIYNEHKIAKKIVNDIENLKKILSMNLYTDIKKGISYLDKENYIEALNCFNKILKIYSEDDFVIYYKSIISEGFKEYDKGIKLIEDAISIIDRSIYYAKKGDFYRLKNNFEDAEKCYLKSNDINPNPYAYLGLGVIYYLKKEYEKSAECFDKVLELTDNLKDDIYDIIIYALIGKAETLNIERYYEEALRIAENILYENPDNITILKIKAYIAYKLKKYRVAIEAYSTLLNILGVSEDILYNMLITQIKAKNYDDAIITAEKLKKINYSNNNLDEIIKKLINREDIPIELRHPLEDISKIYYKISEYNYYLGMLYKFIKNNPILAYIFIDYIENNVVPYVTSDHLYQVLEDIINILKERLPNEMYKFLNNEKVDENLINEIKEKLKLFGYIV